MSAGMDQLGAWQGMIMMLYCLTISSYARPSASAWTSSQAENSSEHGPVWQRKTEAYQYTII